LNDINAMSNNIICLYRISINCNLILAKIIKNPYLCKGKEYILYN
jgi:hypothetical protein